MTQEKIYREGFYDGMRNSGKLAVDVGDDEVQLSHDWKIALRKCYEARNYEEGKSPIAIYHKWYSDLADDYACLQKELTTLQELLKVCNELREVEINNSVDGK
jgi:hypothetical protein